MEKYATLINRIICIVLSLFIGVFIGRRAHAHKITIIKTTSIATGVTTGTY